MPSHAHTAHSHGRDVATGELALPAAGVSIPGTLTGYAGGGQSHENMPPFAVLLPIIYGAGGCPEGEEMVYPDYAYIRPAAGIVLTGSHLQKWELADQWLQEVFAQYPAALNDKVEWPFYLAEGTYDLRIFYVKNYNYGIGTFHLDGDLVGTIDFYSDPPQLNQVALFEEVSVTGNGNHVLTVEVLSKNKSATDYYWAITNIVLGVEL